MKRFSLKGLVLLNIATMISVKNWPFMAQYGLASVAFILLPALLFFLPTALVSAELATGCSEEGGGVFVWVKKAFGERVGFLAVWLIWVSNVVWYPTLLAFVGIAFSYVFNPTLEESTLYNFLVIVVAFWSVIFLNLKGVHLSGKLNTISTLFGTLLPGIVIVSFAVIWLGTNRPTLIDFKLGSFIPPMKSMGEWIFITGILLGFSGIEMNAIYANQLKAPQKNYPKAIILSASIIVFFSILGTVAISLVLAPDKMNLAGAIIDVLALFLNEYNLSIILPIFCLLIAFGELGGMSVWIMGPNRGLLAAAQNGKYLPKMLCKTDHHGTPKGMMIFQAIVVTLVASAYLFFSDVNIAFWVLIALSCQLYLMMYLLMFSAAIVLRYKFPKLPRPFKLPFGKVGLWGICGLGMLCCLGAIAIGFFPPEQLDVKKTITFEVFLILSILFFCAFPFFKRTSRKAPRGLKRYIPRKILSGAVIQKQKKAEIFYSESSFDR